jgi:pimeloyl-ACP methyl ester carboxylesterase
LACALLLACTADNREFDGAFAPASPTWPPYPVGERVPVPLDHPDPNVPPTGAITIDAEAHAGVPATLSFSATDPDSFGLTASIDFGDGTPSFAVYLEGTTATVTHLFATPGDYDIAMRVTDGRDESSTVAVQAVIPRKVLLVQGYGSESTCPNGSGFATRMDGWLPALLDSPGIATATSADLLYASYSGRWCDGGDGANGSFPDYGGGETCRGIDDPGGLAEYLRAQVDAAAPAKVVIVGHSMGGLAAAYLVGSDPDWARDRIASVVTFDSPLRGVPQVNLTALRIGGECSFNSRSTQDLSDGNSDLLRVAETAAAIVPFYNLDATNREGFLFFDLRQPVPGDRTHLDGEAIHWAFATSHNGLWNSAPVDEIHGPAIRQALTCAIELVPGVRCQRPDAPD